MDALTESDLANARSLLLATERLEGARTAVRVARIRLTTLVPGAPLRLRVEATRRLRAALEEQDAAGAAFEAAQDLPAPEG